MTRQQVAERYGVTVRSVTRWMAREDNPIPHIKRPNGRVEFDPQAVEAWWEGSVVGRVEP